MKRENSRIKKPEWLGKKIDYESMTKMGRMLRSMSLHTVCEEAHCPNMGECFRKQTATFMILGNVCTRNCSFCAIPAGKPAIPDPREPARLAQAAAKLKLKHVVITSVTRDDLPDGGAGHFARCVAEVKHLLPKSSVEVLIPDFEMDTHALDLLMEAAPDIVNHNVETVPFLYNEVRPMADYKRSLSVLNYIKKNYPGTVIKSGLMLGLGEKQEEVKQVIRDLADISCDMLTIGQYLPPSNQHALLKNYVHPEVFEEMKEYSQKAGVSYTASGPYVRSSYHAEDNYEQIKKNTL